MTDRRNSQDNCKCDIHLSGIETWLYWENQINTVAADPLTICIALSLVDMVLIIPNTAVCLEDVTGRASSEFRK